MQCPVKNALRYVSAPPNRVITWCLNKHKDNLIGMINRMEYSPSMFSVLQKELYNDIPKGTRWRVLLKRFTLKDDQIIHR
jgi:hypothetical protein